MADTDRDAAIRTAQELVAEMRALRQDLAVVSAQLAQMAQTGAASGAPLLSDKFQGVLADILRDVGGVGGGRRRGRRG